MEDTEYLEPSLATPGGGHVTTTTLPRPVDGRNDPEPPAPRPRTRRVPWPFVALLVATAGLYLWGLGASGWANSFYSGAVQAGTKSWKAFFFGSFDSSNFITIDKPPAALWVMDLSARAFGLNSWSILVPQALEGVAAVALLYAAVRRWFGTGAALIAGAVLALTPVAALMFRFNNPDALLVLLLVGAAYAMVRALERGRTAWLIAAATLVGFGFLTKMLQSLLVVPAFAVVYLLAAPTSVRRRIWQLLVAGVTLIVASLWWVVAVMAVPASSRPYIGGSTNNSLWNLIFGYNGFGRLTGNETGSVGGGAAGATGRWGPTGVLRMLNSQFGGQISWLLPAAVILAAACLVVSWRAQRTDRTRTAVLLWGGWLVVTGVVFSLGQGIIHPYYAIALAPAIAALVGIGAVTMWRRRTSWMARAVLGATVAVTAVWAYVLLDRTPSWHPWLRNVILVAGLSLAVLMLLWAHLDRRLAAGVAGAALVVGLAGPGAYTLATVATPHTGAIPSAGPTVAGAFGRPGGGFGRAPGAAGRAGAFPGGAFPGGGFPGGGFPGGGAAGGAFPGGGAAGGGPGRGLLNGSTSNAALTAALKQNSSRFTWVAATVGANEASGYQIASGNPVMAIGGFNGTDPSPTLSQFQTYVAQGKIHYFIAGGRGFGGPGGGGPNSTTTSTSSQIASWVQSHYTSQTIGGVTVYDLTKPAT